MPQLFLKSPKVVAALLVIVYGVAVSERVGRFSRLIKSESTEIFLDDLLNGLTCPGASLPRENVVIFARALTPVSFRLEK